MSFDVDYSVQSSRSSLPSPPISPLMSRRVVSRVQAERYSLAAQPPQYRNAQRPSNRRSDSAYTAATTTGARGLGLHETSSHRLISENTKNASRYASSEVLSISKHQSEEEEDENSTESDEDEGADEGEKTKAELLAKKRKMKRFRLTHAQTRYLMNEFARQAHPDAGQRERLSREIPGLSPRQVQVWFQNRRAKLKRLTIDDQERLVRSRALPAEFDFTNTLHSPYGHQYTSFEPDNQLLSPGSVSSVYSSMPNSAGSLSIPLEFLPAPSMNHRSPYPTSPVTDRYPPGAIPGRSNSFPIHSNSQRHIEIDHHPSTSRARAETHPSPMIPSGSAFGGNAYHYGRAPAMAAAVSGVYNIQQVETLSTYPSSVYNYSLTPYTSAVGPAGHSSYSAYTPRETEMITPHNNGQRLAMPNPQPQYPQLTNQQLGTYQNPTPFNNNTFAQGNAYDAALQAQQMSYPGTMVQSFATTTGQPVTDATRRRQRG